MAKSSDAHIRANAKYYEANMSRVSVALNRKTQSDVIDKFDTVDSKLGYVVDLVRSDIYRKHHSVLKLHGNTIRHDNASKFADDIDANYDAIRDALGICGWVWDDAAKLYRDDTPKYIILSEVLKSYPNDLIVE